LKKLILFTIAILLLGMLVISCKETATPQTTTAPPPAKATTTAATTTPAATAKPQYGGTLRIIRSGGPLNVGYAAKQAFVDSIDMIWSERIFELATNGDLLPNLAESYDTSADGKVITIHLKKGIKFHDGTDWNAKAGVWTFQTCLSAGTLPDGKYIDSINAVDDYTIRVTLKQRNNKMIYGLTRMFHYSPTAFEKNGEEWAINHAVSTAAFQVSDFQRDITVKMKKFESYWQPNLPYLNEVELRTVKDPATCSAMMQSGQADIWMGVPPLEAANLRDKGYPTSSVLYLLNNIYCDSKNPDSPFANKKIREALEYAIDRPAVAKALGYGFQTALNQLAPPGTQGYNPNYVGRPFNPDKSKQLLAEAGYPSIKTKMTLQSTALDLGTVIKNYLAAVGIEVELDVADPGRYWGAVNGGWKGLLLGVSANNPEYAIVWLDHFGPEPMMRFASMAKSPEYLALCDKVVQAPDIPTMRKLTMDMVTQASQDIMAIPITVTNDVMIVQKNVHTSYYKDVDSSYWRIFKDWLEK